MLWLMDLSDTLITGSKTWAFEHAFPALIQENNLPFDPISFNEITLKAQQKASETQDDSVVLDEMFTSLHWPDHLKNELLKRTFELYKPRLFEDTIPFLEKMRRAEQRLFIVSNTTQAPELVRHFGIDSYFELIVTPKSCGGVLGKPTTALWDCLLSQLSSAEKLDEQPVTLIGDDPWSDGAFAAKCGLTCWIIDRRQRMSSLYGHLSVHWIQSLLEIPIDSR